VAIGLENPFPLPARRAAPRHGRTVAAACRGPGRPLGRRRRVRGGDTKGFLLFEFYVSVSPGHRTGTGTRRRRRLLHYSYTRYTTYTRREINIKKLIKRRKKNYAAAARTRDTHTTRRSAATATAAAVAVAIAVTVVVRCRPSSVQHCTRARPASTRGPTDPSAHRRTDYASRGGEKIFFENFLQRFSSSIFFYVRREILLFDDFFCFLVFHRVICSSIIISYSIYITVFFFFFNPYRRTRARDMPTPRTVSSAVRPSSTVSRFLRIFADS